MDSREQSVPLRRQTLMDRSVQGSLLRRIAFYSLACSLYFMMTLVITESLSNPKEALAETTRRCLEEALFWAPGVMLLTPIIIYDLLRVANRWAGPVFRLRREMQQLAGGNALEPVAFRDGDDWQDVTESFNQIRDELRQLRKLQAAVDLRSKPENESRSQAPTSEPLFHHLSNGLGADKPSMSLRR